MASRCAFELYVDLDVICNRMKITIPTNFVEASVLQDSAQISGAQAVSCFYEAGLTQFHDNSSIIRTMLSPF